VILRNLVIRLNHFHLAERACRTDGELAFIIWRALCCVGVHIACSDPAQAKRLGLSLNPPFNDEWHTFASLSPKIEEQSYILEQARNAPTGNLHKSSNANLSLPVLQKGETMRGRGHSTRA
jgi:hypothetical protein